MSASRGGMKTRFTASEVIQECVKAAIEAQREAYGGAADILEQDTARGHPVVRIVDKLRHKAEGRRLKLRSGHR